MDAPRAERLCAAIHQPAAVIDGTGRVIAANGAFRRWNEGTAIELADQIAEALTCFRDAPSITLRRSTDTGSEPMTFTRHPVDGACALIVSAEHDMPQDILANVSHELRTPLGAILGLTDLALEGAEQPRQRRLLRVVRDNAELLLSLISDTLDMAQLEAQQLSIEQLPHDPVGVVEDVAELLALRAQGAGLSLDVIVHNPVPRLIGDPGRLRQILINLLGNAIKFTEQGGIRIDVSSHSADGNRERLDIVVSDTGIGIRPEQAESVFAPFAQADSSLRRRRMGVGLGLPISRALARAMGGDLALDWAPSREGSTFVLSLAMERIERPPAEAAPSGRGARAALCLESEASIGALTSLLVHQGWSVTSFESVEAAEHTILQQSPPDLVVVDDGTWASAPVDLRGSLLAASEDRRLILARQQPLQRMLDAAGTSDPRVVFLPRPLRRFDVEALGERRAQLHARGIPDPDPVQRTVPRRASTGPIRALRARFARASGERVPLLLVDDNVDIHLFVRAALEVLPVELMPCREPLEALRLADTMDRGIVLLDVQMPGIDGFEVCRQLRSEEDRVGRSLVVIGFTAQRRPGLLERCREAGMDALLQKPISLTELRSTLSPVVDRFLVNSPGTTGSQEGVAAWDFDGLSLTGAFKTTRWNRQETPGNRPIVEVPEDLRELTETYRLDRLAECDRLDRLLRERDLPAVAEIAHQVKGAAASFGFERLSHMADSLERACQSADLDLDAEEIVEHMRSYLETVQLRSLPERSTP
ncbi:MAG: sensor histidine kinase [Deltaproteobacteria bacterium]|nr:MAG: sensor histidine kinase [Deltaproteobacteria bacterium]